MSTLVTPPGGDAGHASSAVAVAAEKRWAIVVAAIIVLLLATMIFTGVHWAAMPPSRVETVDARTLHVAGEFVESNLGTTIGGDGRPIVRLIAQQYSFEPPCIVVPAQMAVTFRATSTDALHGFVIAGTNANVMLVPGFVATFTTTFPADGRAPDAVPRVLRHGPRIDVGAGAGDRAARLPGAGRRRPKGELCFSLGGSSSPTSGSPSRPSWRPSCWARGRCTCAARCRRGSTTRSTTTARSPRTAR